MTQSIESRISYIIGYRQASADRLTGLKFVLSWLGKYLPEMEIILVEQDEQPKLDISLPPNCKKFFVSNPGLYNRCWGFNVGVKKTSKEILAFADSDMFMSREDYIRSFEACLTYEAVNPNGNRVINVRDTDSDNYSYAEVENRKLWTFAAGIMLLQRQAYEKIGGWDERFEGWGVEDDAITHLIMNSLSNITLNCRMYHVDHARSTFDGKTQPNYLFNKKIFEEISALHGQALGHYLKLPQPEKGNEFKYSVAGNAMPERPPRFIYLIMTGDDPVLLKQNLESWDQTRAKDADWTLLVSCDSPSPEIAELLKGFKPDNAQVRQIDHSGRSHIYRFNHCLQEMSDLDFDLCFYSDPRTHYIKAGWDMAYYSVTKRTGLGHLCFFDKRISHVKPLTKPVVRGELICRAGLLDVQSDFFTLTPKLIREVGFLDSQIMGKGRLEFLDYSLRCFRKGFNVIKNPFDLKNSEEYISISDHPGIFENSKYTQLTDKHEGDLKKRWRRIQQARDFIPANDLLAFEVSERKWLSGLLGKDEPGSDPDTDRDGENPEYVSIRRPLEIGVEEIMWIVGKQKYFPAESRIKWNGGIGEIMVGLIRNGYNLLFTLRFKFLIRMMDRFSNFLIRAGVAFKRIDNK